ncbi:hypothetical protein Y09_0637 [Brachybacterium sp. SW0106-09]|nr:hypothetical protein Y09_0637 [Brachybacterium sp. SW0106-09]
MLDSDSAAGRGPSSARSHGGCDPLQGRAESIGPGRSATGAGMRASTRCSRRGARRGGPRRGVTSRVDESEARTDPLRAGLAPVIGPTSSVPGHRLRRARPG